MAVLDYSGALPLKLKAKALVSYLFFAAALTGAAVFPVSAQSGSQHSKFVVSPGEQAYLDSLRKRPILVAYSTDVLYTELDGKPYGILEPVLDILRREFGLTVNMVKTNWRDAFIHVENGDVDFYGPIALSKARRQRYITVKPFYRSYSKIMTRTDNPMRSMQGLYNKTLGLLEGSIISKTMRTYLGPLGDIVYFPTLEDMLEGLENETVDAFTTVNNAEFEIFEHFRHDDIRFEFTISNMYVDQGLISEKEEMRPLAMLLNRYLDENPQISDEVVEMRRRTLVRYSQELLANEIAFLQKNYDEIVMYSDAVFYPMCYMERGAMKGMLYEINAIFKELTGVNVRLLTDKDYPDGIATAFEKMNTGECMAVVGGYYDIDLWNNPDIQYSPPLWLETIRTYSYSEISSSELTGKKLGAMQLANDYLGWNNTTGNPPALYNSHRELLAALKSGEVNAVFMGEMQFNYGYTILNDYNLREIQGISAEANMHMLYRAQNTEINLLLNKALLLYEIIYPQAMEEWKSQSDKYRVNYIRMRHNQQIWMTVAIVVFFIMLVALIYLLRRVLISLSKTKTHNLDLIDKVYYDALTGIYNRRYLEENMARIIKSMSRTKGFLSLLVIDVDYFKKYNDTYGHKQGDACLKALAEVFVKSAARIDDFTARYGGEEFVVVLPNTNEAGGQAVAEKLLQKVRERKITHESSDIADHVTVSIGVATGKVEHGQHGDDYIKKADAALYESKRNGRDRFTFTSF